jgi:hypothetical protein
LSACETHHGPRHAPRRSDVALPSDVHTATPFVAAPPVGWVSQALNPSYGPVKNKAGPDSLRTGKITGNISFLIEFRVFTKRIIRTALHMPFILLQNRAFMEKSLLNLPE